MIIIITPQDQVLIALTQRGSKFSYVLKNTGDGRYGKYVIARHPVKQVIHTQLT